MTGFPITHNSDMAIAPALEIIISAALYAVSIFLINEKVLIPSVPNSLTALIALALKC
jgi:hypothetical protein